MDTEFYAFERAHRHWELKSTLLFMMTSVLKSRTEIGLESNTLGYDEDVNVYLAGLLAAYLDPGTRSGARPSSHASTPTSRPWCGAPTSAESTGSTR